MTRQGFPSVGSDRTFIPISNPALAMPALPNGLGVEGSGPAVPSGVVRRVFPVELNGRVRDVPTRPGGAGRRLAGRPIQEPRVMSPSPRRQVMRGSVNQREGARPLVSEKPHQRMML